MFRKEKLFNYELRGVDARWLQHTIAESIMRKSDSYLERYPLNVLREGGERTYIGSNLTCENV